MASFADEEKDLRAEETVIASNSLYYISRYASKFFFSFIVGVFLVRFLGPSGYGVYSLALVYWGMFSAIFSIGLGSTIQYAISKYRAKKDLSSASWVVKRYLIILSLTAILGSITMFFVSDSLASIYRLPELGVILKILGIGLLFYSLSENFSANVYIGYQKMKYTFIVGVLYDVLRLAQVAVVILGFGLLGAIAFYDVIYLIVGLLSLYLVYRIIRKPQAAKPSDDKDLKEFRTYGKFSYISNIVSFFYGSVMILLLGYFAPNISSVAFYRAGLLMASLLSMPAAALMSAPFATTTKYLVRAEFDKFYRVQGVLLRYAAIVTIPLVIGAAVSAHELITYLYRSQFLGAQLPFQIILVSILITSMMSPLSFVLSAMGKQKYYMYSISAGAAVAIVSTVVLVPTLLSIGAALTYLMSNMALLAVNIFFLSKQIKIRIPYVAIMKSFGAAAVMGSYLYYILNIIPSLELLPFILISGLMIYFVFAYLLKVITRSDIGFFLRLTHLYGILIRR